MLSKSEQWLLRKSILSFGTLSFIIILLLVLLVADRNTGVALASAGIFVGLASWGLARQANLLFRYHHGWIIKVYMVMEDKTICQLIIVINFALKFYIQCITWSMLYHYTDIYVHIYMSLMFLQILDHDSWYLCFPECNEKTNLMPQNIMLNI